MQISFQNNIEYKFNFLSSIIFSFIPFITNILLWFAIYKENTNSFDMTIKNIVTYYIVVLVLDNLMQNNITQNIGKDIRTGEINQYLIKPYNYMVYNFAKALPQNIMFLVLGIVPISLICLVFKNYINIKFSIINIICFILAIIVGYIINFLINYLLSLLAFYISEVSSLFITFEILKGLVTGKIFPINIMPKSISILLVFSPFQYICYFPIMILLNCYSREQILWTLLLGGVWIIILYILSKIVWNFGLKKYSAFGG